MAEQAKTTRIITGKVRFSYANVFQPTAIDEGQTPKYNIAILIPKTDKKTLTAIDKAVQNAIAAGSTKLGDKNGKVNKATLKLPLRDGDVDRPEEEAYAGHMFFNASSTRKPGIVDADRLEIISPDEFYSGCYGRASINFYAFNASGNKGIAAGLQNLQKLADGERLDGSTAAEDDFADDWEDDLM